MFWQVRLDRLNAASDEKFVDCGRLFHAFITRWAKTWLRMCDVYNLYGWPLVVDTGQHLNKSPKFWSNICMCYCCFIATTTIDFRQNSFVEWDFQDNFYANLDKHGAHRTNLQLMFRTRQRGTGLLWKAQNAQKSEYLVLEVCSHGTEWPIMRWCAVKKLLTLCSLLFFD